MANLAKFKELLAQEAQTNKGLPNVVLNQTTDLGQAFSRLVTLDNRSKEEDDRQVTERYVDELCASMSSEESNSKEIVEIFNQSCAEFTEKIKEAWSNLEGIKETAASLGDNMREVVQQMLNADKFIAEHAGYSTLSEDFPEFKWNGAKIMGSQADVAKSVNQLITANGVEAKGEVDQRMFAIIANDVEKIVSIAQVEIDEEGRAALVDQVKNVCSDIPAEAVTEVIDVLLGIRKRYDIFKYIGLVSGNTIGDIFKVVQLFDNFVTTYFPVCDAISSEQIKLADNNSATVLANAQALIKLCKIAAYYEIMQRTTVYANSLLLQGGLVNADTIDEFKQAGGTTLMLAHFLRYMYKDNKDSIPSMGVRGESILKADGTIGPKVEEDIKSVEGRVELAKVNARVNAFKRVAMDYITKKVDRELGENAPSSLKSTKINEYMSKVVLGIAETVRQYNVCLKEASLHMIIALEYSGTFVEHLQKKLGAAYLSLINTSTDVTVENIRCTEVSVISELICNFVADKMIEVIPVKERAALENQSRVFNEQEILEPTEGEEGTPVEEPMNPTEDVKAEPGATPAQES